MISYIVKFNTTDFEYYEEFSKHTAISREQYLVIVKLTAILRLVNAMDRSHKQKFDDVKISLKDGELLILVNTQEDITLEKGLFPEKAEFFEEVFHIHPVIRQKKSM